MKKFPLTLVAVILAAASLFYGGSHAARSNDGGGTHHVYQSGDMGVGLRDQALPRLARLKASRQRSLASPSAAPTRRPHVRRLRYSLGPSARWARTAAAVAVKKCESGNDGSWSHHYGKYRGYWQMDADFWSTYGGLAFASSPDLASESQQDLVAYRGYLDRGWQPWTCARIVGVYP